MADVAIKAEGLGKRYRIGALREAYHTLRDAIVRAVKAPGRLLSRLGRGGERDTIWALKDVSFEVGRGEVVGVIGRNGAGKSTLLKILSRITKPTEGRAEIRGRVGSLLEVGTGFHPELTGRENIFLNGSILGMRRREIRSKFDEIVAFAEIEKFIDTPVKRYSSGMSVRLAFAVAAHLDPEILLVDEVLAVGDAAFQKKCLGKMGDVAKEGRTVLFVSHNMGAVQRLCSRVQLIDQGHLILDAATHTAVNKYMSLMESHASEGDLSELPREKVEYGRELRLTRVVVVDKEGRARTSLALGAELRVLVEFECLKNVAGASIIVGIDTAQGDAVTTVASEEAGTLCDCRAGDRVKSIVHFSGLILNTGRFVVRAGARRGGSGAVKSALDLVRQAFFFEISASRDEGSTHLESLGGVVRCLPQWHLSEHGAVADPSGSTGTD